MIKLNSILLLLGLTMMLAAPAVHAEPIAEKAEKLLSKNTIILSAIDHFEAVGNDKARWYVDTQRASLAVDAGIYKDEFAKVQTTFTGAAGEYRIRLTSLVEIDGESEYRVSVNGKRVASVINPAADIDFVAVESNIVTTKLTSGDVIEVEFNSSTNGKIPEGDTTAYSRGRWTNLILQCTNCATQN